METTMKEIPAQERVMTEIEMPETTVPPQAEVKIEFSLAAQVNVTDRLYLRGSDRRIRMMIEQWILGATD